MKKKISELDLYEVDYLVALAENLDVIIHKYPKCVCYSYNNVFSPTTNPSQAWPIIEREGIETKPSSQFKGEWFAEIESNAFSGQFGKTSLEAAMRCFACSVYGEEVDL